MTADIAGVVLLIAVADQNQIDPGGLGFNRGLDRRQQRFTDRAIGGNKEKQLRLWPRAPTAHRNHLGSQRLHRQFRRELPYFQLFVDGQRARRRHSFVEQADLAQQSKINQGHGDKAQPKQNIRDDQQVHISALRTPACADCQAIVQNTNR